MSLMFKKKIELTEIKEIIYSDENTSLIKNF